MIRNNWVKAIALLTLALIAVATMVALAGDSASTSDPDDEVTEDDRAYAYDYGVSVAEAQRRLKLQGEAGDLSASLDANEAATFAGLWIQHEPDFRVVASFTQDGEATIRPHIEDGPLADIVEARKATAALSALRTDQQTAMTAVSGLDIRSESGINVFENRVELYVLDRSSFEEALREANIELPATVVVLEVAQLSSWDADIYGGLALSKCTSGFAVQNSSGTKGITTAQHCQGTISYDGTELSSQDGTLEVSYDVRWLTAPGFTVKNQIKVQTGTRSITSTKSRDNQVINGYVCKSGKDTGYTCGNIKDKNYQPSGESPRCDDPGNCQWAATWIRVYKAGVRLADDGDSGGPWFSKFTAYGTHSASFGNGNNAIYMAINYIDALNITVLTE